jgi:hypothetical protein
MMGSMGQMMGFAWMGAVMRVNLLLAVGLFALVTVGVVAGIQWLRQSGRSVRGRATR